MGIYRAGLPAVALALCAVAGCGGKSPEEVEAERAKANAEWNAQAAGAERERQAEENRLVQEEVAAHERREQADQQQEERGEAAQKVEYDRLLQLVLGRFPDPAAATISSAQWNEANTALCGTVTRRGPDSQTEQAVAFVARGSQAWLDSSEPAEHDRFIAAAREADCVP